MRILSTCPSKRERESEHAKTRGLRLVTLTYEGNAGDANALAARAWSCTRSFVALHRDRRAELQASAGGRPAEFEIIVPAPLMLYAVAGQMHHSKKSSVVDAVFNAVPEASGRTLDADRPRMRLHPHVVGVDVTEAIYSQGGSYLEQFNAEDVTVDIWLDGRIERTLGPLRDRGVVLGVAVLDDGTVEQKAFVGALRRAGALPQPFGSEFDPAMKLPTASDWASYISSKKVQNGVWQSYVKKAAVWQKTNAPNVTLLLDGPAGDAVDTGRPIVVIPPAQASPAAVAALRTAVNKLYVPSEPGPIMALPLTAQLTNVSARVRAPSHPESFPPYQGEQGCRGREQARLPL